MTATRTYLADFALANPLYELASVAVYVVDPVTQKISSTLAPLYSDLFSATTLGNPQSLDGEGKWLQPVYVDQPVIMRVGNAGAANTDTGISGPMGAFKGDWTTGSLYVTGDTVRDGAAGANTSNVYYCASPHASGVFATDLAAGLWLLYVSATSVAAGVIAEAVAASLTAVAEAGYLTANQTITLSGDATGSGATSIVVALAASGVGGGTFTKVTVDTKGRVTSGTGITAGDVTTALAYTPANPNLIINGSFRINQRAYVSNTSLSAGAYAHDRWKAGSGGCTYTFSAGAAGQAITIVAGSLQQAIDAANIPGGVVTVSWTGTAQGKITGGSYASSPFTTASLNANTSYTFEFGTGTLSNVKIDAGATSTPFTLSPISDELLACQRYGCPIPPGLVGATFNTTGVSLAGRTPVPMRGIPSVVWSGTGTVTVPGVNNFTTTTAPFVSSYDTATGGLVLVGDGFTGFTAGQPAFLAITPGGANSFLSAEL